MKANPELFHIELDKRERAGFARSDQLSRSRWLQCGPQVTIYALRLGGSRDAVRRCRSLGQSILLPKLLEIFEQCTVCLLRA